MIQAASQYIQRERRIRVFFFILVQLFVAIIIFSIPYVLISSVFGIVTFYLLLPVVDFLEDKGFKRNSAALIPFLILLFMIYSVTTELLPILTTQLLELQSLAPSYFLSLKKLVAHWEQKANPMLTLLNQSDVAEQLQEYLIKKVSILMNKVPDIFSASFTTLFLTPFFSYFLLVDGRSFYRAFLRIVPNHLFETAIRVNHEINVQMGQFIRARLLESTIVGVIIFSGLSWVHMPYSLLLALFAAVMNLVPYIGPFIGAAPALALVFISPESQMDLGSVVLIYSIGQIVDNIFIVPFVVAKIVNLHPIAVVIAVLLGSQTLGIVGMLISIPAASALKIFVEAFYKHLTNSK